MNTKKLQSLSFSLTLLPFTSTAVKAQIQQVPTPSKPNIIMILADDMGYSQLGCYGSEINTPHLDSLATNGIRFTQFHNTAKSFPSRACLLTGLYAQQCGMADNPAAIVNSISLGDMLRTGGYATFFAGKNHSTTPLFGFGFDHTCEFLGGSTNHLNPGPQRTGEAYPTDKGKAGVYAQFNFDAVTTNSFVTPAGYYSSNFYTDEAIKMINNQPNNQPFFLYLAFQAQHDPLQALEVDIAKYRGKYRVGYEAIRLARWQKMKKIGMVDSTMALSAPTYAAWPTVDSLQAKEDARMAVMSAMVDNMDQNVAKLINILKQRGQLDNTLIMFTSDNGACTEGSEVSLSNNGTLNFRVPNVGGADKIGSVGYYAFPGKSWPNVCDTPYRFYKNDSYEGGTCAPFIAFWPSVIKTKGVVNNTTHHFIDVMPTLKEISGGTYPTTFRNQQIVPMQGRSFLSILQTGTDSARIKPIFWQWANGTAIRVGNWKAVSSIPKTVPVYQAKFNELKAMYDNWIATARTPFVTEVIETKMTQHQNSFYPVPSKAPVYWSHIEGVDKVEVSNLSGSTLKIIDQPTEDFVDISNLNKGIYFIKLYKNKEIIASQKIIKE
jgi:arylsulfatase A-like enzyme